MDFEIDPNKSASNAGKHGIDFIAAQALWLDQDGIELRTHFPSEARWLLIGKIHGKHWSGFYTLRGNSIRIISVRPSRKEEKALYENQ
jgi:uncharacterized DUF497 family protein